MLDVVAGLILDPERGLLACRRPPGKPLAGKWEFPGGKIEPGETPAQALVRELEEELGIAIIVGESLTPVIHDDGHGPIRLIPLVCRVVGGVPEAREHSEIRWCQLSEWLGLDLAAADAVILAEWIRRQPPAHA